ncbi:MAG: hypothetical protein B7Y07_01190 [Halothiobacillus sp. 24-54-40]|jgi:uncharacterized membrane protein|nr:DUF1345 domain-containing protein [Halothiobacillaceae bacterium]OYY33100.1 MAG: hypothetical protein B7Y58_09210 [Halothiobacillus sp. 35-54-62]OYZ88305.1 MAG: hypothetical protein B7Y07_01190 [Halothiobacillus sp. 24-54-40]OZA79354.1 MAG: hypothetical protein B7X64_10180 [Halothiobacillus sp. 39-53-45]HQS01980.1 DUF1345 domain-containing protein [Halothiobacillus sp.]
MDLPPVAPMPKVHPLAYLRTWQRTLLACVLGLLLYAASPWLLPKIHWEIRSLFAWVVACVIFFTLTWGGLWRMTVAQTRWRSQRVNPGARTIYLLLLCTVGISLIGILQVSEATKALTGFTRWMHILLAFAALTANWLMIQTIFALSYAHHYYHPDRANRAASLGFPGLIQNGVPHEADPSYSDFAYFAVVVGMTAQTADVTTKTTEIRRLVLVHGLISFAYNILVLALSLNLIANALP